MRIFLFFSTILILSSAANASVVTLDFENLAEGSTEGSSVTEDGFTVATDAIYFIAVNDGSNQTLNLLSGNSYFISENNGQSFDLLSLDTQEWHVGGYDGSNPTRIIGNYAAGGQIEMTLPVPGSLAGLDTANFNAAWSGLSSLEIQAGGNNGFYLDNVAMSVVPVPAAAWLFGSALAGLGWIRRKQVT